MGQSGGSRPRGRTGRERPGFPSAASPPWKAAALSRHSGAQLSHEPPSAPHSEPAGENSSSPTADDPMSGSGHCSQQFDGNQEKLGTQCLAWQPSMKSTTGKKACIRQTTVYMGFMHTLLLFDAPQLNRPFNALKPDSEQCLHQNVMCTFIRKYSPL